MDERERVYCARMMLAELAENLKSFPGDTRKYLSLDTNDEVVIGEALIAYLAARGI